MGTIEIVISAFAINNLNSIEFKNKIETNRKDMGRNYNLGQSLGKEMLETI